MVLLISIIAKLVSLEGKAMLSVDCIYLFIYLFIYLNLFIYLFIYQLLSFHWCSDIWWKYTVVGYNSYYESYV